MDVKKTTREVTYNITGLTSDQYYLLLYGLQAYEEKEWNNTATYAQSQRKKALELRQQLQTNA